MFWFLLLSIISNTIFAHKHTHDCIHDKIEHNQLIHEHIEYNDHPFDPNNNNKNNNNNNNKRNLVQSTQYKPIRIRPYYDPSTFNTLTLSTSKISYIKSLVSAAITYLEKFVSVIPVEGPLLISRCQRIWFYNEFLYSVCPLSDYTEPIKCQYATIPDEHMAESWYYDQTTKKSTLYKSAGPGISNYFYFYIFMVLYFYIK